MFIKGQEKTKKMGIQLSMVVCKKKFWMLMSICIYSNHS